MGAYEELDRSFGSWIQNAWIGICRRGARIGAGGWMLLQPWWGLL